MHVRDPETNPPTDGAVVRAVLGGRSELYRLLVRRHQDAMYRHALRMVGSPDDAADLVQQAFVTGFKKLMNCKDPESVGGWLFRITANRCKDFLKNKRRQVVSIDETPGEPTALATPVDEAERADVRRRVNDALERLPVEQREAFVLKHVEGHSYDEMAELLGASVSALKMRVLRAREELQGILRVCL